MAIEVLTGILVLITGFYAWVTYRIMDVNRATLLTMLQQAEALARPYVSVRVFTEPNNPVFYLRIANTGRTAANNARLQRAAGRIEVGAQRSGADAGQRVAARGHRLDVERIEAVPAAVAGDMEQQHSRRGVARTTRQVQLGASGSDGDLGPLAKLAGVRPCEAAPCRAPRERENRDQAGRNGGRP